MQGEPEPTDSFLLRHDFLLRRLHSLSGLVPVGAYLVVHLLTNASVLESAARFQDNVYSIHSLGRLLPVVEWTFIFIPILFHAILGMVIIAGGSPNTANYPLTGNIRYTLQRATGMIAFAFIMWHVFQMRGWIHESWWAAHITRPLGGAQFRPYNAASTAGLAMQSLLVNGLFAVGILSSVFHLANGLWTAGITWGLWISPAAQRRASRVCVVFGIALAAVGLGAQYGMWSVGHGPALNEAIRQEDKMYHARLQMGELEPTPEKRSQSPPMNIGGVSRRTATGVAPESTQQH